MDVFLLIYGSQQDIHPATLVVVDASVARNRIALALEAPWRVTNEVRRLLLLPYLHLLLRANGVVWGRGCRWLGAPMVQAVRGSTIRVGQRVTLRSWPASNPLAPNHPVVLATRKPGAVITIGDDCGFTGVTLVAAERIQIGHRVQVGANSTIVDTGLLPLLGRSELPPPHRGRSRPGFSGRRSCFAPEGAPTGHPPLGAAQHRRPHCHRRRCLHRHEQSHPQRAWAERVPTGREAVTIGRGSVVGAGSVVTRDVPAGVVVAGNPAVGGETAGE